MTGRRGAVTRIGRIRRAGSLGGKLVAILTGVGLLGAIAITLLLVTVIMPNFTRLEAEALDAHVDRTRAALTEVAAKVESSARDYGDWDASYEYMTRPTRGFEEESFSTLAMANLGISGMAYVDNDGRIAIARWLDDRGVDAPALRRRLVSRLASIDLARALGNDSSTSFYMRLGGEVAAIGVARVRRSDGTGAPRGYVLMARQMSSVKLSELLQLDATLDLSDPPQRDRITAAPRAMTIAVPIRGVDGHAVAAATFTVARDVSLLGRRMLLFAVFGSVVLLAVVLLALKRMISRLVLKPLSRVEARMQVVRASGSMALLPEEARDDEIGSLNRSFNSMLRQLKDLREQVEVQSFALGKSESAVAVMHNVRNALSPVSTILSKGAAQEPRIDRATLDRAIAELAGDEAPSARRRKLAAFVAAAVEAEEASRAERRHQLQLGREAMAHVLDIIGVQQAQAHERPPLDLCDVTEIVAQNATIARYSGDTSIAFSFPAKPHRVLANRVILSQVIGNLFANAADAIAARGPSGSITVSIRESGEAMEVAIRDDGEGFAPALAAQLFARGYSTRRHKSGGLGLHWCANAMTAMEGALRLESEGEGCGAVATLTMKAAEAEAGDYPVEAAA